MKRKFSSKESPTGTKMAKSEDAGDGSSCSFSRQKCIDWFNEYHNEGSSGGMEPNGVEKLCHDLQVETDHVSLLVLAWMMDAKRMGYLSLDEWLLGLARLQCDSLTKLRHKLDHLHVWLTDMDSFNSVFLYAFDLCRKDGQTELDVDTAKTVLVLLLGDKWPLLIPFLRFLNQSPYCVIDKSQWFHVLQFSCAVGHVGQLDTYHCPARPQIFQEFVQWLNRHVTVV